MVEGPSGGEHSIEFGINGRSVLDTLPHFDVCSGALLPDIMHDLLEGALQYETKLLLKEYILKEHFFTLDDLNEKLQNMELGYMECKDRPTLISDTVLKSSDNKLQQNGR